MKFPRFLSRFLGRDKKPEVTVIEKTVATVTESTFFSELNKSAAYTTAYMHAHGSAKFSILMSAQKMGESHAALFFNAVKGPSVEFDARSIPLATENYLDVRRISGQDNLGAVYEVSQLSQTRDAGGLLLREDPVALNVPEYSPLFEGSHQTHVQARYFPHFILNYMEALSYSIEKKLSEPDLASL